VSLLASSKTVLILEDDGLQIFTSNAQGMHQVESIPWSAERFTQTVSAILVKKCKKRPVIILNDMVEQHYRKEQLPKTGITDKGIVLKRKLNATFPNYRIRSALKLKATAKKDRNEGDTYLFAAIPRSESIKKTIGAVQRSGVGVVGLYLLPVEGVQMVSDLSKKLSKKSKDKSKWTIFLGQQNHGSLRQIVVRNGELALTRMTPIVDTDIEPDLWAKELSTELDSTMSYLSRFGYQPGDAMEIFVIANEETHLKVNTFINLDADIFTLTAHQAAKTLGATVASTENGRYAYSVYSGYLSKKSKYVLPLEADALQQYKRPRQIAIGVTALLTLALIGLVYMNFIGFTKHQEVKDKLNVVTQQLNAQDEEYQKQLGIAKSVGFDYALIEGSIDAYNQIKKDEFDLFFVMKQVGASLGSNLRIDDFILSKEKIAQPQSEYQYQETTARTPVETVLTLKLSFPNIDDPTEAISAVESLSQTMDSNLRSVDNVYVVRITKQIADFSFNGDLSGGGQVSQEDQIYQAEIQIRKQPKEVLNDN